MGHVIGVSKRCCPVCTRLLAILSKPTWCKDVAHFKFRASHGNITGCSLPPWLPTIVHQQMVKEFGEELRQYLEKLILIETAVEMNEPGSPDSDTRSESSMDDDAEQTVDLENNIEWTADSDFLNVR